MKVAFALIIHLPHDERIWFQEAKSLQEAGCETFIVSARMNDCDLPNTFCFDGAGMSKKELIIKLAAILRSIAPDVIICDNPMAVFAAHRCKKQMKTPVRVIYDVTEWYPSKKNLRNLSQIKKIIKAITLIVASYSAAWLLDGFIFGEYYKARPFRVFFPWKKHIYLSYYADIQQIVNYPPRALFKECVCLYSGPLTQEKGFDKVLKVVSACAKRFPETQFILRFISKDDFEHSALNIHNLKVEKESYLPFPAFCESIGKADLFFDLRDADFENTHCLPIKLFYYMAAGRPVIYSDLKAIRKEAPETDRTGLLINPKDTDAIVSHIARYIQVPDEYQNQCRQSRQLAENKYNWEAIKSDFVQFIMNHGETGIC